MEHWTDRPQQFPICPLGGTLSTAGSGEKRREKKKEEEEKKKKATRDRLTELMVDGSKEVV